MILIAVSTIACASKQNAILNVNNTSFPPRLIFLNYVIKKNSDDTKTVQFVNKIVTEGKLKKQSEEYIKTGAPGDLKCIQLDKNGNKLHYTIIKNPLIKSIEYLNDDKSFGRKIEELNRAPFSLRLQIDPRTKSIIITEISLSEKEEHTLITTNLDSI
ncbi:hypothetical protein GCM10022395_14440 [Snuella lapsa]|uniref:Lipoprotein n=1 Tax=Snuella lapsa TaxID=870481 RepID=A0ABP6XDI4_9FLAO